MTFPARGCTEPAPSRSAGEKILLVEDKEGLRDALQKTLRAEGFGVEACGDGKEALRRLDQEKYLLVLTDLSCPAPTVFRSSEPPVRQSLPSP